MITHAAPQAKITMPRWFGPVVSTILRSPAHLVVSNSLLLLTVRGRRSGREVTLPLGYVDAPDGLIVIASEPETKNWWRNLSAEHPVKALVRGRWSEFVPEVTRWRAESASAFEAALAHYLRRFAFIAERLGVTRAGDAFDQTSLRAAARQIVMVRLTPLAGAHA